MSPLDCAKLCVQLYASADGWAHYWTTDDVVCGHQVIDGVDVLVFRGSVTAEDWIRDFDAIPIWNKKLGFVHAGFFKGLDILYPQIQAVVGKSIVITGHSLGAARACLTAGLFAYDAAQTNGVCPVTTLYTFGQPRSAFINLARIIEKSGMTHQSWRNRNDPICQVPFSIAPFLDFVNTEPWTPLDVEPAGGDLDPMRDHSIALYVQGLA